MSKSGGLSRRTQGATKRPVPTQERKQQLPEGAKHNFKNKRWAGK